MRIFAIISFFFIFFLGDNAFAQTNVDKLIKMKPMVVGIHPIVSDTNIVYLPMEFSSSEFKTKTLPTLPSDRTILTVHLVYTKFREVDTFNQPLLNRNRYENLKTLWPELFALKGIQFRAFEQNKAKTEDDAKKLFHGFIIFYKAKPTEKVKKDIK